MTERLYYTDPYCARFAARVVRRIEGVGELTGALSGQPAVVLDRTAFYPTGGGQPHDTGWLNGIAVVDVVEQEDDGAIVHILAGPLDADDVEGQVDWDRRFDLMQQHSGQHILSAAFAEQLAASTVSFHLSDSYSTIDLDRAPLSAEDLVTVEAAANAIVFQNRPAIARFVADEEVLTLSLRKPLVHKGPVRIVEIAGFDSSACGGTHVRATGEVGLVKITRTERRGAETRVEFVCGYRALADYRAKNSLLVDLALEFTVGHWELAEMVRRLAADLKETRHEVRRVRDALLDAESAALWYEAGTPAVLDHAPGRAAEHLRVVRAHFSGRTPDELKHLAQRLIARPRTAALLASEGNAGEKSYLAFARSDDLEVNMGTLLRQACEVIGGQGGGRPNFAQGGGPHGEKIGAALDHAQRSLSTGG